LAQEPFLARGVAAGRSERHLRTSQTSLHLSRLASTLLAWRMPRKRAASGQQQQQAPSNVGRRAAPAPTLLEKLGRPPSSREAACCAPAPGPGRRQQQQQQQQRRQQPPPPQACEDAVAASPPQLASPPSSAVDPPPGLSCRPAGLCGNQFPKNDGEDAASPLHVVALAGMPNALLSRAMLQVVLQQAGFELEVRFLRSRVGEPCGEVLVGFAHRATAERCAAHFRGCQWDASGTPVSARLLTPPPPRPAEAPAVRAAAAAAPLPPPLPSAAALAAAMAAMLAKEDSGYAGHHQQGAPAFVALKAPDVQHVPQTAMAKASKVAVGDTFREAVRLVGSRLSEARLSGELEADKDFIKAWAQP